MYAGANQSTLPVYRMHFRTIRHCDRIESNNWIGASSSQPCGTRSSDRHFLQACRFSAKVGSPASPPDGGRTDTDGVVPASKPAKGRSRIPDVSVADFGTRGRTTDTDKIKVWRGLGDEVQSKISLCGGRAGDPDGERPGCGEGADSGSGGR